MPEWIISSLTTRKNRGLKFFIKNAFIKRQEDSIPRVVSISQCYQTHFGISFNQMPKLLKHLCSLVNSTIRITI